MPINENTWHPIQGRQTTFSWESETDGIRISHGDERAEYVIPWNVFSAVLLQAQQMANANNNVVAAGTSEDDPLPGSVGAWVINQQFAIIPVRMTPRAHLTPRHLSFLGPIFGRIGLVTREVNGNFIQWRFA